MPSALVLAQGRGGTDADPRSGLACQLVERPMDGARTVGRVGKVPHGRGTRCRRWKTVMYAIRAAIRTASPSRSARHSRPVLCRRRKATVDQRGECDAVLNMRF